MAERFYFEKPSAARKADIVEYLNEFTAAGSEINGSGSLDRILSGWTFEQALDRCLKMENREYAEKVGRCPGKTFLLIRENDSRLVGTVNVRWDLNEEMLRFGGHIGYGIRPSERRNGYNKINLYLALKEAGKIGLDRVMIDCSALNIASDKTIQALGGVLERRGQDPADGKMTNVYWINVEESLMKYKAVYEPYIALPAMDTISVRPYTVNDIPDVIDFENCLRTEEDVWGWEIDDAYVDSVTRSFHDGRFDNAISFLAYMDNRVVGRIDAVLIPSYFDGSVKAYLDWICVLKSCRHQGVAQAMLDGLKKKLKDQGVDTLIALTASNDEAQRFYKSIPDSEMHDIGIWITIK